MSASAGLDAPPPPPPAAFCLWGLRSMLFVMQCWCCAFHQPAVKGATDYYLSRCLLSVILGLALYFDDAILTFMDVIFFRYCCSRNFLLFIIISIIILEYYVSFHHHHHHHHHNHLRVLEGLIRYHLHSFVFSLLSSISSLLHDGYCWWWWWWWWSVVMLLVIMTDITLSFSHISHLLSGIILASLIQPTNVYILSQLLLRWPE